MHVYLEYTNSGYLEYTCMEYTCMYTWSIHACIPGVYMHVYLEYTNSVYLEYTNLCLLLPLIEPHTKCEERTAHGIIV